MCRNESVDTNWFIFRHARRLRNSGWTFANVAQHDASVKQFGTVCTLEQPATILKKSCHALNQFCKNDSSGKTWLSCWNCSRWHGFVRVNHVRWCCLTLMNDDLWCGTSWHVVACFASCACWAECPYVWETSGNRLGKIAKIAQIAQRGKYESVVECWVELIPFDAPHHSCFLFYKMIERCITLWHCGTSPKYVHAWETRSNWRRLHHVW